MHYFGVLVCPILRKERGREEGWVLFLCPCVFGFHGQSKSDQVAIELSALETCNPNVILGFNTTQAIILYPSSLLVLLGFGENTLSLSPSFSSLKKHWYYYVDCSKLGF